MWLGACFQAAEIMIQKTELQKRLLPDNEHDAAVLANQQDFEERQSAWTRESREWTRRQNLMYRSYRHKNHTRIPVQKNPSLGEESIKKHLKRKRNCNEILQLPPPPPALVRNEVFFCKLPDLEEVFGSNADVFDGLDVDPVGRGYPRFGRGGRLVFDRCPWKLLQVKCSIVELIITIIVLVRKTNKISIFAQIVYTKAKFVTPPTSGLPPSVMCCLHQCNNIQCIYFSCQSNGRDGILFIPYCQTF